MPSCFPNLQESSLSHSFSQTLNPQVVYPLHFSLIKQTLPVSPVTPIWNQQFLFFKNVFPSPPCLTWNLLGPLGNHRARRWFIELTEVGVFLASLATSKWCHPFPPARITVLLMLMSFGCITVSYTFLHSYQPPSHTSSSTSLRFLALFQFWFPFFIFGYFNT